MRSGCCFLFCENNEIGWLVVRLSCALLRVFVTERHTRPLHPYKVDDRSPRSTNAQTHTCGGGANPFPHNSGLNFRACRAATMAHRSSDNRLRDNDRPTQPPGAFLVFYRGPQEKTIDHLTDKQEEETEPLRPFLILS